MVQFPYTSNTWIFYERQMLTRKEFKSGAQIEWRTTEDQQLAPFVDDREVAWAPQAGSQEMFLTSPILETLYEGTRGPGKTEALLVDFGQHVGQGYGADWRGVLFRKTFPELQDVIEKSQKLYRKIWPAAEFNQAKTYWTWPTGERLSFRPFSAPRDYYGFHGHAYPWIGWEELTTWPDLVCYLSMFSCSRSVRPGMPRKIRSTTNPYGIGHNWVKARWRLPILYGNIRGPVIRDSYDRAGQLEPPRVAIRGRLQENKILLHADPDYVQRIRASASNPQQIKAWLLGDWNIVSGGMFDDVWDPDTHVVPRFAIPHTWRLDRSFDWGSAKPFSVGWWAESDGSDVEIGGKVRATVRGDLFRIGEWYGWRKGFANEGLKLTDTEISTGIVEREIAAGIYGRVNPGPAGSDIFSEHNRESTAMIMRKAVRINDKIYPGILWLRADNKAGSRVQGWRAVRDRLQQSKYTGRPRQEAGLFIVDTCQDGFLRTVPGLVRDDTDLDDVDTTQEDHAGDESRYRVVHIRYGGSSDRTTGAQ